MGTCPMINGFFALCFRAHDFGFECLDARVEFGDRQWVKILSRNRSHGVAGTWVRVFRFHVRQR